MRQRTTWTCNLSRSAGGGESITASGVSLFPPPTDSSDSGATTRRRALIEPPRIVRTRPRLRFSHHKVEPGWVQSPEDNPEKSNPAFRVQEALPRRVENSERACDNVEPGR